jgi:hypothetical protein
MNTVFTKMYTSTRPDPTIAFGPTDFISTVWKLNTAIAGATQQDSHEFLMFLLNCMHSHQKPESPKKGEDERGCKCLAHQVFGGESQSTVTCSGCGKVNRKVEMMFDLGLQIRGKPKVVFSLNGKNGSVKGSPISPSSSGGSSDIDGFAGESLQDCLDRYYPAKHFLMEKIYCSGTSRSD